MKKTRIEWCDSTENFLSGCFNGCAYCYARAMVKRFSKAEEPRGTTYVLDEPVIGEGGRVEPYPYGFAPTYHRYRLEQVRKMGNWKPSNIFICSMADLFGEWVPDRWIEEIVGELAKYPKHNYLFLTKNPRRYARMLYEGKLPTDKNFWYGSTVTTGDTEFFINEGCNTFLSIEPILEDFGKKGRDTLRMIDWVIIGAETGNRKGKVVPKKAWIDNIVEECDAKGVPVFMKDSLIPIIGEENMRREFPAGLIHEEGGSGNAG